MENKYDVIMGKLGLLITILLFSGAPMTSGFQLFYRWRMITNISFSDFDRKIRGADFEEVYCVNISQVPMPPAITGPRVLHILKAYPDVLPKKLLKEL